MITAPLARPHIDPDSPAGAGPTVHPTTAALAGLPSIGLADLDIAAALQTRTDRKYLVAPGLLPDLLGAVDSFHRQTQCSGEPVRVLDIGGTRSFAYRSTYFDTPDLFSYHQAARSRPTRFKVRTRSYLATGTCWLEVKVRNARGETVKDRIELPPGCERHLTPEARTFLAGHDQIAPHLDQLTPALVTTYDRATLHCGGLSRGQRVTVDAGLGCSRVTGTDADGTAADGTDVALGDLTNLLIVETKSAGHGPGPFDRALWGLGVRPTGISKYAVGMAASQRSLPANKWHRLLQRHVVSRHVVTPAGATPRTGATR